MKRELPVGQSELAWLLYLDETYSMFPVFLLVGEKNPAFPTSGLSLSKDRFAGCHCVSICSDGHSHGEKVSRGGLLQVLLPVG